MGTLNFLEKQIQLFKKIDNLGDPVQRAAMERFAQLMIDAVLDTGNAMIDGFIMRDPASFDDIIDILLDEKVLTKKTAEDLKSAIGHRKGLVQDYLTLDSEKLYKEINRTLESFSAFPEMVRNYLNEELGPVNAFK